MGSRAGAMARDLAGVAVARDLAGVAVRDPPVGRRIHMTQGHFPLNGGAPREYPLRIPRRNVAAVNAMERESSLGCAVTT